MHRSLWTLRQLTLSSPSRNHSLSILFSIKFCRNPWCMPSVTVIIVEKGISDRVQFLEKAWTHQFFPQLCLNNMGRMGSLNFGMATSLGKEKLNQYYPAWYWYCVTSCPWWRGWVNTYIYVHKYTPPMPTHSHTDTPTPTCIYKRRYHQILYV